MTERDAPNVETEDFTDDLSDEALDRDAGRDFFSAPAGICVQ